MNDFSPEALMIFDSIARHCPAAMTTFLHILSRLDADGNVHFTKTMVDVEMSEDWNRFRSHVKKLAQENILSWCPLDEGISINMVVADDD